jgi:outer membrane receptor protein involved in Fe transport
MSDVLSRVVSVDVDRISLKRAVKALARSADVRIIFQEQALDSVGKEVSLHVTRVPLGVALERVLQGTGLSAATVTADVVSIKAGGDGQAAADPGIVVGIVRNAKTQLPLRGATVTVDDARKGVTSAADGTFQLSGVPSGEHLLRIRLLGYVKTTRPVTVRDGETVTVEVALEASAAALEQVVVTGTIVATERKAIPNAITIITAKELEERGITRIDQLFRGDVPGLFTPRVGVSTATGGGSGGTPGNVQVVSRGSTTAIGEGHEGIKTYVDGVELANREYLGLIDPKSIERIEILTGPQASTIYGSNAINGVMQIFTKRGSTIRPQITAELRSAWTQNNFSSALAPRHTANLAVSGVDGRISYNVGGSWGYTGSWSPSVQEQTVSGFGGERFAAGPLTLDGHLRVYQDRNFSQFNIDNQSTLGAGGNGVDGYIGGVAPQRTRAMTTDRAAGLSGTYPLLAWWSHTVTLGLDQLAFVSQIGDKAYGAPKDSTLYLTRGTTTGFTAAYNTTLQVPMTQLAKLVLTLGVDESHTAATGFSGNYVSSTAGSYQSPD